MLGLGFGFTSRGVLQRAAGGTWTPADLGAARVAHWQASALSNGAVASWADSVGGLAPAQASGTLQPIRAATSFNSAYPGVTFDGTDDLLVVASTGSLPVGTAESWVCVIGAVAGTGPRTVFVYGTNAASASRQVSFGGTNLPTVTNFTAAFTDSTAVSGPFILIGRWVAGGATEEGYINGRAFSTPSAASATNTSAVRTVIGAGAGGSGNVYNGVYAEIIVTSAITTLQRQQIEGYWAWFYSLTSLLPAGHPYKSARP